jgi:hypothetical protein
MHILRAYAHPRIPLSRSSRSLTTALTTIERICTPPYRHWVGAPAADPIMSRETFPYLSYAFFTIALFACSKVAIVSEY